MTGRIIASEAAVMKTVMITESTVALAYTRFSCFSSLAPNVWAIRIAKPWAAAWMTEIII